MAGLTTLASQLVEFPVLESRKKQAVFLSCRRRPESVTLGVFGYGRKAGEVLQRMGDKIAKAQHWKSLETTDCVEHQRLKKTVNTEMQRQREMHPPPLPP